MDEAAKTRLKDAMDRSGLTMKALSVRAGVGETFVRDVLERDRDPGVSKLARVARALNVSMSEILVGSDDHATVPLVGYVGAGAVVVIERSAEDAEVDRVPAPPETTANTVAVEVRGESMAGLAEPGWLIYFDERRAGVEQDMIGRLCIVWLEDDRVLVKKVYPGTRRGLWNLLSTTTLSLETDVAIRYIAAVTWIRPR